MCVCVCVCVCVCDIFGGWGRYALKQMDPKSRI